MVIKLDLSVLLFLMQIDICSKGIFSSISEFELISDSKSRTP